MCLVSFEEAFDFTLFYDVSAEYLFQQKFIRTWRKFSRVRRNSLAGIVSYRSYWIWNISRRVSESLNAFEIQLYPFQHGIGHESNRCNKFARKSTMLHCLKIFVHCYVKRLLYKPM